MTSTPLKLQNKKIKNSQGKFQLLKNGSNSKIYRYGGDQSSVILKTVPVTCLKQSKHLENQYKILKKVSHPNIVNVLKYKQNVNLGKFQKNTSNSYSQDKLMPLATHSSLTGLQDQCQITSESQPQLLNILIMQNGTQGNLLDFYKKYFHLLSLNEIKYLFLEIVNGMEYLHLNYIAHRDIKLQNILVFLSQDQKRICLKIADFGFSQNVYKEDQNQFKEKLGENDDETMNNEEESPSIQGKLKSNNKLNIKLFTNFKGTKRGYMSPQIFECFNNSKSTPYDALQCDIFALGVILFSLVMGKLPFEFGNIHNTLYKFISKKNYEQFWVNHSKQLMRLERKEYSMVEQFKNLFQKMVEYNCKQRISIEEVLEHEWLKVGSQQLRVSKIHDYRKKFMTNL